MNRIFISYKRVDKDRVFALRDLIEAHIGKGECWIDLDGIESDAQFKQVIIGAINKSEVVLFMYSKAHTVIPDYEKDWTVRELDFASSKHKRIVFVNIDGTPLTDGFRFDFGSKQQVDGQSSNALNHLIKDLKKWLGIPVTDASMLKTVSGLNPAYKMESKGSKSASIPPPPSVPPHPVSTTPPVSPPYPAPSYNYPYAAPQQPHVIQKPRKSNTLSILLWIGVGMCALFSLFFTIVLLLPTEDTLYYDESSSELVYGSNRYKMVPVEGGTFTMGATLEQIGVDTARINEMPEHSVTLSSYSIGQTEVPQWLWVAVMGNNPSNWKGDNLPVELVSWHDCQTFISELNRITEMNFSLPTEAQWEFAARGGNKSNGYWYSGSDNLDDVAWYEGNSGDQTHEVATKSANELELYDMSGNVSEWCSDWYGICYPTYPDNKVTNPSGFDSGISRVCRGGCEAFVSESCRVAFRDAAEPDKRYYALGFRLAL